jgi:hypothetical protein
VTPGIGLIADSVRRRQHIGGAAARRYAREYC